MRLPVAREGLPFIAIATIILLAAAWWARGGQPSPLRGLAPLVAALLLVFVVYFFRDPERTLPAGVGVVVSPADGRILSVQAVSDEPFMDREATRITIFLSIFNVHVQRAPLSGVVGAYEYHPGGYAVAWHEKASTENERATLGIRTEHGPVVVRQIAGLVARRIVTYPRTGDAVDRGERIGLIRFGSRVDLFIPKDWSVEVSEGDRVQGGESILAQVGAPDPDLEAGQEAGVVETSRPGAVE
ncbi:MAG: phosphatidylserine decarboxylase family protein [Gemmatimonadetes bacterium]|nr:phosphatidylserine decarboxylase family protein [Gemmatimonadota bacterium]